MGGEGFEDSLIDAGPDTAEGEQDARRVRQGLELGAGLDLLEPAGQRGQIDHVGKAVLDLAPNENLENFPVDSFVHQFFEQVVVLDDAAQGRDDLLAADHLAAFFHLHGYSFGSFVEQIVEQRRFVLEVDFLLAPFGLVQRWLGDVEMAALDQLGHLPEEEGQQQGADMGTIDVGVGHDNDAVIAQLGDVEVILADAGAHGGDQGANFRRGQHLVKT